MTLSEALESAKKEIALKNSILDLEKEVHTGEIKTLEISSLSEVIESAQREIQLLKILLKRK